MGIIVNKREGECSPIYLVPEGMRIIKASSVKKFDSQIVGKFTN